MTRPVMAMERNSHTTDRESSATHTQYASFSNAELNGSWGGMRDSGLRVADDDDDVGEGRPGGEDLDAAGADAGVELSGAVVVGELDAVGGERREGGGGDGDD